MTDLSSLRDNLITLQGQTLKALAGRSGEHVADAGLLALLAGIRAGLVAIDDEESGPGE
jgi:hypothetical protein